MQNLQLLVLLFCFLMHEIVTFTVFKHPHGFKHCLRSSSLSRSGSKSSSEGLHGDDFVYMPMIQGSPDEPFPRIIAIAGVYPGVTYEQIMAPEESPYAEAGQFQYVFSDPDASQLGTIALPGSDVVTRSLDPVIIIAKNSVLNVECTEDVEILVMCDRGDKDFKARKFFVFKNPDNSIDIRYYNKKPADVEIVGRVDLCAMPFVKGSQKDPSGFLEDE